MTNSLNYKVWISGLGETDVSGSNRIISTQPHLGSLFKSQNNTTWSIRTIRRLEVYNEKM